MCNPGRETSNRQLLGKILVTQIMSGERRLTLVLSLLLIEYVLVYQHLDTMRIITTLFAKKTDLSLHY